MTKGQDDTIEFQLPTKRMTRVFCKHRGDILYNTNAMGWKLVSQLLFRRCNSDELLPAYLPNAHFVYDRRIIDIEDSIPKK